MSANGTFRILQVADLHYSVGDGLCRDTPKSPCVGDVDTASLLARVLDAEKPDLVVFSGDQLNGQDTSWDAASVLAKFAKPVIDRKMCVLLFITQSSSRSRDEGVGLKLVPCRL